MNIRLITDVIDGLSNSGGFKERVKRAELRPLGTKLSIFLN